MQTPVTLITVKKGKPKLQYKDSNQETKEIQQIFESNDVHIYTFILLEQELNYTFDTETNEKEKEKEFKQINIKESNIIFDFDEKDSKKYGTRVIDAVIDYSSPSEKKIIKEKHWEFFFEFLNQFSKKGFQTKQSSKVTFKSKPENIAKILFVLGLRYSKSTLKKIFKENLEILFSFYVKYHFKLSELSKEVLIKIFGKSLNFENTIWFNFINTILKKELMINLFLIPSFQDNLKNTIFPNLLDCFQFWMNFYNFVTSAEMRKIRSLRSAIMQIASIFPDIVDYSLFNQPCLKNEKRSYIEKLSDLVTIFKNKSYYEYSNKQIKNNDERLNFLIN
ncbi:hypothetical protein M0811_00917 [Anaeramoeba ignava]|uniref:Uncharacterized protein n=1 Tax=Anaeramoeba ignava TaxID=1746090 RepID=A0A9Q0LMU0_ANAIG|nr:hypothetical protein M0811_00917 [Anaeramoeba ignava]